MSCLGVSQLYNFTTLQLYNFLQKPAEEDIECK
jgi:hypothetical protein